MTKYTCNTSNKPGDRCNLSNNGEFENKDLCEINCFTDNDFNLTYDNINKFYFDKGLNFPIPKAFIDKVYKGEYQSKFKNYIRTSQLRDQILGIRVVPEMFAKIALLTNNDVVITDICDFYQKDSKPDDVDLINENIEYLSKREQADFTSSNIVHYGTINGVFKYLQIKSNINNNVLSRLIDPYIKQQSAISSEKSDYSQEKYELMRELKDINDSISTHGYDEKVKATIDEIQTKINEYSEKMTKLTQCYDVIEAKIVAIEKTYKIMEKKDSTNSIDRSILSLFTDNPEHRTAILNSYILEPKNDNLELVKIGYLSDPHANVLIINHKYKHIIRFEPHTGVKINWNILSDKRKRFYDNISVGVRQIISKLLENGYSYEDTFELAKMSFQSNDPYCATWSLFAACIHAANSNVKNFVELNSLLIAGGPSVCLNYLSLFTFWIKSFKFTISPINYNLRVVDSVIANSINWYNFLNSKIRLNSRLKTHFLNLNEICVKAKNREQISLNDYIFIYTSNDFFDYF
ncbi:MAG: hypothetical protein EOP34_07220, partial [Rickettsiales bacterium]